MVSIVDIYPTIAINVNIPYAKDGDLHIIPSSIDYLKKKKKAIG